MEILNRVSSSQLVTFDLEELYTPGERMLFDLKGLLFQELVLREKEFRDYIKSHNWSQYKNKFVAITCSADAIVPTWAFMLVSVSLQPYAQHIIFGTLKDLEQTLFQQALTKIDWSKYHNAKVVIKGCSKVEVPLTAYVEATSQLRAVATSIMFGEPCSTVPIYKKKSQ
jgi:WD40 repeat protein